ncbi:unnamed protein product, partial [Prorocentrum cordatum]
ASSDEERLKLLVGLHYKFYHPPDFEIERMIRALGLPAPIRELCKGMAEHCETCLQRQRAMNKPSIKMTIAVRFNERARADLFFVFEKTWLIMIDECIRHRIACLVATKQGKYILRAMLSHWIRYFGPMDNLVMDQEGGMTTDNVALVADRYNLKLVFGGADGHATTGLAERAIQTLKPTALKTKRDVIKQGLTGPAEFISLDNDKAAAIVIHQNQPYKIPTRHMRARRMNFHVLGISWDKYQVHLGSGSTMKLTQLFEIRKGTPPGIVHRMGIFNEQSTPPELLQEPPPTWQLAQSVGMTIFRMTSVDGIIYGQGHRQLKGLGEFTHGVLVAWRDRHREDYYSSDIDPAQPINMAKFV